MTPMTCGMFLWGLAWAVHYYVTNNLKLAQAMENSKDGRKRTAVSEARLRDLDTIAKTVWWALMPFAAVVLGSVLPHKVRVVLEAYVTPTALISASLAVIFAHFALQQMLTSLLESRSSQASK